MGATPTERINVIFPKRALDDLRRYVPARQRSTLIVRTTESELRRIKLEALLGELEAKGPAWHAEGHAELRTPEVIDHAIAEGRAAWSTTPPESTGDD